MRFLYRWFLNWLGRRKNYGGCLRCQDSWYWKEWHCTDYAPGSGGLPLCEECWKELGTPGARMPYYDQLLAIWWINLTPQEFSKVQEQLHKAVQEGK